MSQVHESSGPEHQQAQKQQSGGGGGMSLSPPGFSLKASPIQQKAGGGTGVVQCQLRDDYPFAGVIVARWSCALRSSPGITGNNTLADLPEGSSVTVIGRSGGWLQVRAGVRGTQTEGYVSRELVDDPVAHEMENMLGERATWRQSWQGSGSDFEQWASAPSETAAPALTTSTTINCWEMVLLAAYRSGTITWNWIHNFYVNGDGSGDVAGWIAEWSANAPVYVPGNTQIRRGQLVFFNGPGHVALATGNGDEIYSFWPPPDTPVTATAPPYATVDRVKTCTIQEMVDVMRPGTIVQIGSPSW